MPFVAHKATLVRAYVRNDGAPTNKPFTARLCKGSLAGPCLWPNARGPKCKVPTGLSDRGELASSFNFVLPRQWTDAGAVTYILDINPPTSTGNTCYVKEANRDNNQPRADVTYNQVPPLEIRFFLIDYQLGSSWYRSSDQNIANSMGYIRMAYPVDKSVYTLPAGNNHIPVDLNAYKPYNQDQAFEALFMSLLPVCPLSGSQNPQPICVGLIDRTGIGILPPPDSPNGIGSKAKPDFGLAVVGSARWDTVAHEVGHVLGSNHKLKTFITSPKPNDRFYAVLFPTLGTPSGVSSIAPTVFKRPWTIGDLMSYENERWSSDVTYQELKTGIERRYHIGTLSISSQLESLAVRGIVELGNDEARFETFYPALESVMPISTTVSEYSLQLLDSSGFVLATYPIVLEPTMADAGGTNGYAIFQQIVSLPNGTEEIALKHGQVILAIRSVSTHSPYITIMEPNGGEGFGDGIETVSWRAGDADDGTLYYYVEYSANGGLDWRPVSGELAGIMSYPLDFSYLPGSQAALIRVTVSDGVNSASDTSDAVFLCAVSLLKLRSPGHYQGPCTNLIKRCYLKLMSVT